MSGLDRALIKLYGLTSKSSRGPAAERGRTAAEPARPAAAPAAPKLDLNSTVESCYTGRFPDHTMSTTDTGSAWAQVPANVMAGSFVADRQTNLPSSPARSSSAAPKSSPAPKIAPAPVSTTTQRNAPAPAITPAPATIAATAAQTGRTLRREPAAPSAPPIAPPVISPTIIETSEADAYRPGGRRKRRFIGASDAGGSLNDSAGVSTLEPPSVSVIRPAAAASQFESTSLGVAILEELERDDALTSVPIVEAKLATDIRPKQDTGLSITPSLAIIAEPEEQTITSLRVQPRTIELPIASQELRISKEPVADLPPPRITPPRITPPSSPTPPALGKKLTPSTNRVTTPVEVSPPAKPEIAAPLKQTIAASPVAAAAAPIEITTPSPAVAPPLPTPAAVAPPAPVKSTPATAPLSSFTARINTDEVFKPLLEVDAFSWPEACQRLSDPSLPTGQQITEFAQRLAQIEPGKTKTVALVGCSAQVGCTTLLLAVARQLAQAQVKAMLVDADFTRPELARQLGVMVQAGWDDVLSGEQPLGEAAVVAAAEGLTLIPWRERVAAGSWLTSGLRATVTFDMLRSHGNLILIDGGTIEREESQLDFISCSQTAQLDEVYLVFDGRASMDCVAEHSRKLREAGVPVVGAIENFAV